MPAKPPAEAEPRPGSRELPYSVSRVVRGVNRTLDRVVGTIWIEGEVSSLKRPSSGHVYFSLSDGRSQLAAIMWRSDARRLRFELVEGMSLRCRARLGLYHQGGRFQLYVSAAEPAGAGADALRLEELKRRLAAEGLFDAARKRPLPLLPRRIGVVTSRSGAAIRDIVRAVQRRFPVPILVADARVQGASAPRQIVHGLGQLYRAPVDVIILGRGGGSSADLSAFNDARVVRVVAKSPVPLISAVGHEVDVTLTDLAADHRAATPTMAGEMAVPVLADLSDRLAKEERRLAREIGHRLRAARHQLDVTGERLEGRVTAALERRRRALAAVGEALAHRHPRARLSESRRALDELGGRLGTSMAAALARRQTRLAAAASQLSALSPLRVLERGYAIAQRDSEVLTDARTVAPGDSVAVRLRRGRLDCRVEAIRADVEEE